LEGGSKALLFYGSVHSNNPNDPMFDDIEKKFYSFQPDFVWIEGGYNEIVYTEREKAIKNGEMAFVSFLTRQIDLTNDNIDPPDSFVDNTLLKTFAPEAIFTMCILRQVYQYQREIRNNPFDFPTRIVSFANQIIEKGTLNQKDTLDFVQIFTLVKKVSGLTITAGNWKETDVFNTVYNPGNTINEIYEKVLQMRDTYALDRIIRSHHEYNKVFVIMGGDHLKLAKMKGDFVWHDHRDTDEVFIVIEGSMSVDFRDKQVSLTKGEMIVVPKGVEHKPYADSECKLLVIEPAGTKNTGDQVNDRTAEDGVWI
jgi:mannose-6-phosphate isomerase-like protein (cupin superfamily)